MSPGDPLHSCAVRLVVMQHASTIHTLACAGWRDHPWLPLTLGARHPAWGKRGVGLIKTVTGV